MTKKKINKPPSGFKLWPNALCGYCGFNASEDPTDPYLFHLICPECYRDGCDECMPFGRGCKCPDCEENRDD
jgi:hypothetical protein